ncbi:unnamed protein product [Heligmosomoides polygyrus]|uniref:Protein FAM91A1 n=1 Tax=Heligmosomoides polygyrus TaxID=6339 RepID=A0A3P7XRA8_HELPZ|nr:unnamed protein product [Heligmosomoides polygyrus]
MQIRSQPNVLQCYEDLKRVYEAEAALLRCMQHCRHPAEMLYLEHKLQKLNTLTTAIHSMLSHLFMERKLVTVFVPK